MYMRTCMCITMYFSQTLQAIYWQKLFIQFLDMILENLKEVLIAAQFDRARLMVIKTMFKWPFIKFVQLYYF